MPNPDDAPNANEGVVSMTAISSLLLGLSSFALTYWAAIIGLILGVFALSQISVSQGRLKGRRWAVSGIAISVIGLVVLLLVLPVLQATKRLQSLCNLGQLGLVLLNYESEHKCFPSHDSPETDAAFNVSWRVKILPYLERQDLYDQYDQTQPWDSESNLALLEKMPLIYTCPNMSSADIASGLTVYQVPYVDLTKNPELQVSAPIFESGQPGINLSSITDGTSSTIAILEVDLDQAVPWTKPDDWEFDPDNPTRGLGALRFGGVLVAYADGGYQYVSCDDPVALKALFTRSAED